MSKVTGKPEHPHSEPLGPALPGLRARSFAGCIAAGLFLLTFAAPQMLSAQGASASPAQTVQAPKKPVPHPVRHHATTHRRRARAARTEPKAAVAAVPAPPTAPPKPDWPVNQPASPATITWDSQGLEIQASNSSLDQILHEVATDTGTKITGLNQDERIFGTYGPGPARDVLSRLLDGSSYNVLMIGGIGDAPPQQVILTRSAAGTPQPVNMGKVLPEPEEQDEQPQPAQYPEPRPMPIRNPFGGGDGPPRTPQEIQREMLLRQQELEPHPDQQQQDQQ